MRSRRGFTLVELVIVLVIIGLIIAVVALHVGSQAAWVGIEFSLLEGAVSIEGALRVPRPRAGLGFGWFRQWNPPKDRILMLLQLLDYAESHSGSGAVAIAGGRRGGTGSKHGASGANPARGHRFRGRDRRAGRCSRWGGWGDGDARRGDPHRGVWDDRSRPPQRRRRCDRQPRRRRRPARQPPGRAHLLRR
ncbi:MAG: prepilin-type N-terminal cleavage/methylation domain-containing protein [Myxococcales bacterium]|nr:prepilin-type N-terminal cleavage/methylation domain-containing protein [Myxococcales bacterium]